MIGSSKNDGKHIFVFGSNLAGRHGKGAALGAKRCWGAEYGNGKGRQGMSYAIPTKDEKLYSLDLHQIQPYVDEFIQYAKAHPELTFLVTRVGCMLAGNKDSDIAPMFKDAPENVSLHSDWEKYLSLCQAVTELVDL